MRQEDEPSQSAKMMGPSDTDNAAIRGDANPINITKGKPIMKKTNTAPLRRVYSALLLTLQAVRAWRRRAALNSTENRALS